MGRMWYAIPENALGKVHCKWKDGCRNAATHIDSRSEKPICPICYEEQLWEGKTKKHDVVGSIMTAVEKQASNGSLQKVSDTVAKSLDAVNKRDRKKSAKAEEPKRAMPRRVED